MRINYSEEEDYPGQFNLWQGNCDRSIAGRNGKKALRELEAALLALPSPRLIANELDDGADCCAIGALVRYRNHTPKADPEHEMAEIGVECGMPRLVAWKVVELNDVTLITRWDAPHGRRVHLTPEERYIAVLKWVRERL